MNFIALVEGEELRWCYGCSVVEDCGEVLDVIGVEPVGDCGA